MSLTIAQLNSAVYLSLGSPDPAICDSLQIHNAVRGAVTLLTKQMRSADTNQPLSVTAAFTPTASPYEVTALVGKSTIAWLERKDGTRWKPVRVVNKAFLEPFYEANNPAAAVYSNETNQTYIDFSVAVDASSTQEYRIWYDKDAVTVTRATETLIPDSFAPYVERLAQNTCIARIKLALASSIESEENRRIIGLQLEAWDGVIAQNMLEIQEWKFQWKRQIHRQRTAQTADRLPNKSGKNFYGG